LSVHLPSSLSAVNTKFGGCVEVLIQRQIAIRSESVHSRSPVGLAIHYDPYFYPVLELSEPKSRKIKFSSLLTNTPKNKNYELQLLVFFFSFQNRRKKKNTEIGDFRSQSSREGKKYG
jgi:hypothetical protein